MKKLIILGAGESGVGAALLAKKNNCEVFVSEYGRIKESFRNELIENKIRFEEGGHSIEIIQEADVVIKSPGISGEAQVIRRIREKGIEVISEIEYAYRHSHAKIIGITGSNGKTTTTLLTHHILKAAGISVGLCGNIGKSYARLISEEDEKDWYVIELSSFQLDDIVTFSPDIAILLNISADHLDRYQNDINLYAAAKFRIVENQKKENLFIYNYEDELILKNKNSIDKGQRLLKIEVSKQENNSLLTSKEVIIDINEFQLKGIHNRSNALFAIEAALEVGISAEEIKQHLKTFKNVNHRMENVAVIDEVLYVNDSKATNVEAVYFALSAYDQSIVWIVGGKDKGNDYSSLLPAVLNKVKAVICLGVDNSKLVSFFTPHVKVLEETQDINEAVRLASQYAEGEGVVLLSPACASFDLFNHYEHRGEIFKKAVFNLLN